MDDCCSSKESELAELRERHGILLKVVLAINLVMFFVESIAGWLAGSTALFADSLDMLGDAFVYGMSIYALGRDIKWNARASLVKGVFMGGFGVWVIGQATYRFFTPGIPVAETMGLVGGLALVANITCAVLLLRHRNDDLNMRSTWLCTRNDVIANIGVLVAAALVALTQSKYPDLVVGALVAAMVLRSSFLILRESSQALSKLN